ncbi:MAG: SMP-30/gluconolactonase/LRE family protein [Bryobacteraceae bacterium]|nr:SMP-30/gluconolactonase/LRE family protein [Bryobacteraceae bacterium]
MSIEIASDSNALCGECPVWDPLSQTVYWTDCTGRKVFRLGPGGEAEVLNEDIEIFGFRRNRSGGFAITNTSGVWLWDGGSHLEQVASEAEGQRLQVNDCAADSRGRLLTGSFFYDPGAAYELGSLIRIDNDGKAAILDGGYHLVNGLGFSPDERTLYATDTVARLIYAYDYHPESGSARNRRVFTKVSGTEGIPDGLAVDSDGFVWSAQWYGGCVVRYDPDGKVERRVSLPAKQISAVAFGGPDLDVLYVTSAAKSEPMPIMPPGYDPDAGFFGGPLYRLRPGVRGQIQWMCDIRLSR